jgi:hypothetical protein
VIGNGKKTFMWHDVWVGECLLKTQYPLLFSCCEQQDRTVAEVCGGHIWGLTFNRSFTQGGDERMERFGSDSGWCQVKRI